MLKGIGIVAAGVIVVALGSGVAALFRGGFSARTEPSALEAFVARRLRLLAIPRAARTARNPVAGTDAVLRGARLHFADHCAICHAADGSGETTIGQNLYPEAPDLRADATQSLSDGELFFIIHNGIRFTGMPGWGNGAPEDDRDSWELVHLIRRFRDLTAAEIAEIERAMPRAGGGEHGATSSRAPHAAPEVSPGQAGHSHHHGADAP